MKELLYIKKSSMDLTVVGLIDKLKDGYIGCCRYTRLLVFNSNSNC